MSTRADPRTMDLTGHRFGRLVCLEIVPRDTVKRVTWRAICDCGRARPVSARDLRSGDVQSCGCLRRESIAEVGRLTKTHGMTKSPEYNAWRAMRDRCTNPEHSSFKDYGGRGIAVCERWSASFEAFLADMGRRPGRLYSIERKDNALGYEPGNCIWATANQQNRNTRANRMLTFDGRTMCASAWAEERALNIETLYHRLRRGWSTEKALTHPLDERCRHA